MAVDYSTDVGKVRNLIPDTEQVDFNDDGTATYLFTDMQLQAMVGMYKPDPGYLHLAAADAVQALATSEILISKVIKTEDLETDGAKVANALLIHARQLRDQARRLQDAEDQSAFDIVAFKRYPKYGWGAWWW